MAPKSKVKATKSPATGPALLTQQQHQVPNWPLFQPLLPSCDLGLSTIHPAQIITTPLWPSSLCAKYISFLRTLPFTTTPNKPKRGEAVRVNDRFQVNDPKFAEVLWSSTGLKELLESGEIDGETLDDDRKKDLWGGEVLGLNPNIRVYRYSKGQFFDQHYDDSNALTFTSPTRPATPAKTTWTLLLYLSAPSTGCVGGETVFYPEPATKRAPMPAPVVVNFEVGMGLLHKHGKDCLLHEGKEVTDGEKWVIRSDLCVRR